MPAEEPSSANDCPSLNRISAPLGTNEYERQFIQQSNSAMRTIARIPLVRVACGLLSIVYSVMVVVGSIAFAHSQLVNGFQAWEILVHAGSMIGMWWLISMQGRIALHGEFGIERGLFAPRQNGA